MAQKRKEVDKTYARRVRRLPPNAQGQEQQHFLLTAAAVDWSTWDVGEMTPEQAYSTFEAIRFAENGGRPQCPHKECRHTHAWTMRVMRKGKPVTIYKCAACRRQFSATTGTTLRCHKKPIKRILFKLMNIVEGVSGVAALKLRRSSRLSYKTAFVFEGRVREAMMLSREKRLLTGTVEIDGTVSGDYARPATLKVDRKDLRRASKNTQSIVVARERGPGGQSRVTVVNGHETLAYDWIRDTVQHGSHFVSDEGWNFEQWGRHDTVKHKEGFMINGISNNLAESFFARYKRMEEGVHYRTCGHNVDLYAQEVSWREDNRRLTQRQQWEKLIHAVTHTPVSLRWSGYWQRWQLPDAKRRRRRVRAVTPSADSPGLA